PEANSVIVRPTWNYQARRKAPGRSCNISNFEGCPGLLPVAVGFDAGFANASLALIARIFLLLFSPFFFLRCFWLGMPTPFECCCRSTSAFMKNNYGFQNSALKRERQVIEYIAACFGSSLAKSLAGNLIFLVSGEILHKPPRAITAGGEVG